MIRQVDSTPCPVPSSPDQMLSADTDETTTNFDFTNEFRASFRNVKPKRRHKQSVQFAIHEDEDGDEDKKGVKVSSTVLLQPARRIQTTRKNQIAFKDSTPTQEPVEIFPNTVGGNWTCYGSRLGQAPKRPTPRSSRLLGSNVKKPTSQLVQSPTNGLRPARRGTIYIPNEDTTMPSMYMGIFSPIKHLEVQSDAHVEAELPIEMTGLAAQIAFKRRAPRTSICGAPRRAILQPSQRVAQETANVEDKHGQGGGKENVPPGAQEKDKFFGNTARKDMKALSKRTQLAGQSIAPTDQASMFAPTASSTIKCELAKQSALRRSQAKPAWNRGAKLRQTYPTPAIQKDCKHISPSPRITAAPEPRVPTRFVVPTIRTESAKQKHALLQEDVANPVLYEEDWLQHQEVAITQLINNLFSASKFDGVCERRSLRSRMMEVYNSTSMVLIYKRLQAALLYGALSIPQETLEQGARLQNDIGLKKRFTDLWLCTYNLEALESALEIVVGRECRVERLRVSATDSISSKFTRSGLRNFIEAFLIRNEDSESEAGTRSLSSWSYQRTVLRSLLLIKLLDLAKTEPSLNMKDSLFQLSSSLKTSTSVVQALIQMLNPAAGDPMRPLCHIDYNVSHVQHPLEEFNYQIDNIAVDLRDGIRLTRLVEILLYPSCSQMLQKDFDGGTTTILMPEGETLGFLEGQDWPLSQHLKTICQSRAVRLWNVQLALSSLKTVKAIGALIQGVTAEDIVDGFREKTLQLLWALVGKWGLSGLVDWQDLKWEIQRLERTKDNSRVENFYDDDLDVDGYSFEVCKGLVRRWSRAVAALKDVGIQNFTTSFADGKAFEAIVSEYEPYIQTEDAHPRRNLTLQDRLTRLGCSTQFAQLFSEPKQTHIFDRDFVLAALAFLCSRLLAPSRRARAATVIQRAWRHSWSRIEDRRREQKRRTALACANLVNSKRDVSDISRQMTMSSTAAIQLAPPAGSLVDKVGGSTPISPGEEDIWLTLKL